ncbi:MAG: hypothetical protein ACTSO6_13760 [Promethearchaeota archaeon]
MTIDWSKAEEKLDKKQAVEGRNLLELRNKGDYLREKLKEAKEKLEESNENLFQIKDKFHLLYEEHEKSTATNRSEIKEKEEIINNLKIEIDEVKIELEKRSSEVSEIESLLKEKEQKFLQITNSSGNKISRITSELEEASGKISEVENNLNITISNSNAKDEEIRRLKAKVEELDTEKNNLEVQLEYLSEQKGSEIQNLESALVEKNKLLEAQAIRIEEVEKEIESLKPPEVEESAYSLSYETRIVCPLCQAVGKDIREVEDKKTILYYRGGIPIYAKKYVCKKCGYEWK